MAAAVSLLAFATLSANARQVSQPLQGSVTDAKGAVVSSAKLAIRDEKTGKTFNATSDGQGHFLVPNLPEGTYTVEVYTAGFRMTSKKGVHVGADHTDALALTLQVGGATDEISVDADATHSIAAAYAPMDALLDEHSARTEITSAFIQNFTSPLADYGEAVNMAPGTFTTNGNGIGLGQSSTYFRGFSDGEYDIDFDGLPFYDTNSPTHHSWAFFPSQWLGGIDFDRSPGTASTIGPTPFGGSIHLLSKDLSPVQNIRGGVSYGSWGTLLADVQYDSGATLPNKKLMTFIDVQHMDSKGYQSNNFQNRNAGSIKLQYKLSDKTTLTGFSGVVFVDANTPNFNATRCQMYGAATGYTCTGANALYAGAGIRFYLAGNTDTYNPLNYTYNKYHVPTDFEYVGLKTQLPFHLTLDFKPYTYNYDNSELYTAITPIVDATTINGSTSYLGLSIAPCNVGVTKKSTGVTALPCGVDKYNSYRKYGETLQVSQTSKLGILRAGLWYEWARTNRHQFPSDPVNHWADQTLPNFSELFWNNTYQPYAEYEFHVTKKLNIVAGTKFSYFKIDTKQFADDGKTIGNLCNTTVTPTVCSPFVTNHGSYTAWLPSADANYRILNNWSAYFQVSTGTIVPPSNVYDYNQTITPSNPNPSISQPPKQQRSTTYQGGTVLKLKRVTLDMDAYHIKFQNSYTSSTNLDPAVFYLQPGSVTKGFEAEGNIYFGHGLSAYLNATVGRAYYEGNVYTPCIAGAGCTAATPLLTEVAPSGQWVAKSPTDTEAEAITYQGKGFDVGLLNKRVGTQRLDNGSYHNQGTVNPFGVTNAFLNYTLRRGTRFDQTKIRLSVNNLFDQHNFTSYGIAGAVTNYNAAGAVIPAPVISANGTTYADSFNPTSVSPINGADTVSIQPGRSIVLSVTFGFTPKH
ncbi:TonB-dependent receptor [Granulicella rosea]|nr:TonB-dependent receptor [Granulicella rosea]